MFLYQNFVKLLCKQIIKYRSIYPITKRSSALRTPFPRGSCLICFSHLPVVYFSFAVLTASSTKKGLENVGQNAHSTRRFKEQLKVDSHHCNSCLLQYLFMDLSFTTKSVKINGQNHRILLQNENGPCALLALANILILSPDHTRFSNELIRLVNKGSQISLKELIEVLADIALQVTDKPSTDISELLSLLPRLHEGLNINPEFNGSFENTKEMSIFRLFNVDVVHGWVINSFINENIDEKLSHYSYESAQRILTQAADINCGISQDENSDEVLRDAMHLGLFLNESPTQLTAFGLLRLREKLLHNKFSILFRNDHFSTLFKYEDRLYTLVTDFGYKNCKDIVWQSLDSVDGSCDAFLPVTLVQQR